MKLRNKKTTIRPLGYYIDDKGIIIRGSYRHPRRCEIGNIFDTLEEAEKVVEKLRAWRRLKDNGFKFTGCYDDNTIDFVVNDLSSQTEEDLGLLFGSEE